MSLTLEGEPRSSGRTPRARTGLLGEGTAASGMLEMPVLFKLPDVAEMPPGHVAAPGPAMEPKPVVEEVAKPQAAVVEVVPPPRVETVAPAAPQEAIARELPFAKAPATVAPETLEAAPIAAPRDANSDRETWFDSHTKLLVVCFLIALAAVVYMARSKRRQSLAPSEPTAQSADWPEAHPGEAAESPSPVPPPEATSAAESATPALPAESAPTVKLQTPVAGGATTPKANEATDLFPWKQSDGSTRTAAKPASGSSFSAKLGPPIAPDAPAPTPNPRGNQNERTGSGLY